MRPSANRIDENALPDAMHAKRHEIIHDVVFGRHAFKHGAHHAGLFGLGDFAVTEICLWGGGVVHGTNISAEPQKGEGPCPNCRKWKPLCAA